jgi:translation initiation factor eIF-2B subunit alpha
MMGLQVTLGEAAELMKSETTNISVASACELFARFVTRTSLDTPDFGDCVKKLIERGERFTENSEEARKNIASLVDGFIRDEFVILTHSMSRVVMHALVDASKKGKRFVVLIPESRHDGSGYVMARHLTSNGVPCSMIMDSAVAHLMDQVDIVLVGAEAIVENGGIINKMGTYQISLVAKALSKPFYVLAETFKFTRLFPLTQRDFPQQQVSVPPPPGFEDLKPRAYMTDFTPPAYISLLFTELGVLTPSAVSDELIQLYL